MRDGGGAGGTGRGRSCALPRRRLQANLPAQPAQTATSRAGLLMRLRRTAATRCASRIPEMTWAGARSAERVACWSTWCGGGLVAIYIYSELLQSTYGKHPRRMSRRAVRTFVRNRSARSRTRSLHRLFGSDMYESMRESSHALSDSQRRLPAAAHAALPLSGPSSAHRPLSCWSASLWSRHGRCRCGGC